MLKRFEFDEDGRIDYTPIGDCVDFREANELLLEAYRAIVEFNRMYKFETGEEILKELVLKAEKYIREVEK